MVRRLKQVKKSTWIRLGIGLALMGVVLASLISSPLKHYVAFDQIIAWVEQARANGWSRLIFYCFFIIGVMFFPITLFPIIGGVLFDFWVALPLNILAATTGAWLSFMMSRFFGRRAVEFFLKGKLRSFDRLASAKGLRTVLILRLLGVPPFIVANYALGLSGVRSKHFIVGTVLGIFPWTALVTFASNSLWQAILIGGEKGLASALFRTMGPLMLLSAGVIVTAVVLWFVKHRQQTVYSNL